ncbi:type VII secretion protein EssB [Bacillus sp. FJAT-47783]|uniref:type VII secretion protein EssB n=1 Tax=Bacillus sp. FJAT-47783 TaxID=2922712 RepID=UPI001FACD21C|nr:type VII secretion protein EssB [Bacillus sp. FJAT-47783]
MSEKNPTYLEEKLQAVITKENGYTFSFQKEKIKLDHAIEIDMVKEINPDFQKDIVMTDDELHVTTQLPAHYKEFHAIQKKDDHSKWLFTHQLVKKVNSHPYSRLHLIVCPDNIVFDQSLEPSFLHYGVKESIPPYEKDEDRVWHELKATIAAAVDSTHSFDKYLKFHETLQLSSPTKDIMAAQDMEGLLAIILNQINEIEKRDKTFVHIPEKKWKIQRYVSIGLLVGLVPAIIYTFYSVFFQQPKQAAFIASNEHFLKSEYSEVIDSLNRYSVEDMPNVVKYELATSYVINESLTEEQKENIQKALTLHSDPQYYDYWIHIGRGENEEALEIARTLEDQYLIGYGLIKYRDEIKLNDKLSGEEKQQKIDETSNELEEIKDELKEKEKQELEEQEEKQPEKQEEPPKEQKQPEKKEEATKQPDQPDDSVENSAPTNEDEATSSENKAS